MASRSQGESDDYRPDRGGIGCYTMNVSEGLEARRLIVANHGLLLSHLDDISGAQRAYSHEQAASEQQPLAHQCAKSFQDRAAALQTQM